MRSVTMEIRDSIYNPDCLAMVTDAERGILFSAVHHAFGPLPERPYTVTYELAEDEGGGMLVKDISDMLQTRDPGFNIKDRDLCVCFLPPEWIGKRVTRRIHNG